MPEQWELCVEGVDRHGRRAEDCLSVSKAKWFRYRDGDDWQK